MIRPLILPSDPRLHEQVYPVNLDALDQSGLLGLIEDLHQTMIAHLGVGLAAPQLGLPYRMFVMQTPNKIMTCVNPEIIFRSEHTDLAEEGCLSYPGDQILVRRALRIKVIYWDANLKCRSHYLNQKDARIFQHEHDHLDGIVMQERKELE